MSSPFYSVPTETPGEGAASGRESRHSGGAVRHGTARYRVTTGGTEHSRHAHRHNVQRERTRHRTSRWKGRPGLSHPRHLVLTPPPPSRLAECHDWGWGPVGVGYGPPLLVGREARWQIRSGGKTGPSGGLGPVCDVHTVHVFTARGAAGARGPEEAMHLSSAGEAAGGRRDGALLRGAAPWEHPAPPVPRPPASPPALGTGRAPCQGAATECGLPTATGSSITSA